MDKSKIKVLLLQWSKVENIQKIAAELYSASDGDARKLNSNHQSEESIYGVVSKNLFEENNLLHRYLLWLIWSTNKGDVKGHFASISYSFGKRKRIRGKQNPTQATMCWCHNPKKEPETGEMASIKCQECKQFFHLLCSGLTKEDAKTLKAFKCFECAGTPKLPTILEETLRSKCASVSKELFPHQDKVPDTVATKEFIQDGKELNTELPGFNLKPKEKKLVKSFANPSNFLSKLKRLSFGKNEKSTSLQDHSKNAADTPKTSLISITDIGDDMTLQVKNAKAKIFPHLFTEEEKELTKTVTKKDGDDDFKKPRAKLLSEKPKIIKNDRGSRPSNISKPKPSFMSSSEEEAPAAASTTVEKNRTTEQDSDFETVEEGTDTDGENKREDKKESSKTEEVVDLDLIPRNFDLVFPADEWKKIFLHDANSHEYTISKDYGNLIYSQFRRHNKICVLTFEKRMIRSQVESVKKAFFLAYAHCKGKICSAKFYFEIQSYPKTNEDTIRIGVRTSGTINHNPNEKNKRHLSGAQRTGLKQDLKSDLASNVRRKMFLEADNTILKIGNYDVVKTLKVLQQARVEKLKEQDYHHDVLIDLLMTKLKLEEEYPFKIFAGYIQHISLIPFSVVMYTDDSMALLRRLSLRRNLNLYFDATSSICTSLPEPLDTRRLFYYALVVTNPKGSGNPIPVLEFHSSKQDVTAIMNSLELFFQRYKQRYNIHSFDYRISRLEIDFSKAMLSAAVRVFQGSDLDDYMRKLWKRAVNDCEIDVFTIHVCRIHVIRFLVAKFKQEIPDKLYNVSSDFFKSWSYRFVNCRSMEELNLCIYDILLVVGSMFQSERTQRLMGNAPYIEEDNSDVLSYEDWDADVIDCKAPFYERSPFGRYFGEMANNMITQDAKIRTSSLSSAQIKNPYSNEKLVEYLRVEIFPYSILLTKIPFIISNLPITDDSTNVVERWMNVTKTHILKGQKHDKISRVIRTQAVQSMGAVKEGLVAIPLKKVGRKFKEAADNASGSDDDEDLMRGTLLLDTLNDDEYEILEDNMGLVDSEDVGKKQSVPTKSPKIKKSKKKAVAKPKVKFGAFNSKISDLDEGVFDAFTRRSSTEPDETIATNAGDKTHSKKKRREGKKIKAAALSPEKAEEGFKTLRKHKQEAAGEILRSMCLIPWGGEIESTTLLDTCSFDCIIQFMYYLYNYNDVGRQFLQKRFERDAVGGNVRLLLQKMSELNFSETKKIWITEMLLKKVSGDKMSFFEEEVENSLVPLTGWFIVMEHFICKTENCRVRKFRKKVCNAYEFPHTNTQSDFIRRMNGDLFQECKICHSMGQLYYEPVQGHDYSIFMFSMSAIQREYKNSIPVRQWPVSLDGNLNLDMEMFGFKYRVIAYTLYSGTHYTLVFVVGKRKFLYDGLHPTGLTPWKGNDNLGVSTVWLQKTE